MQNKFYLTEKLPEYVFEKLTHLKIAAVENGIDVIDFGMGNPDSAPPAHVLEKMSQLTRDGKLYGYSQSGGIDELKKAFCGYYKRRFDVELDFKKESLVTIGAKEGVASLCSALADSQNYICVATPSYPIHRFGNILARSNVVEIAAFNCEEFLENFKKFVAGAEKKPIAVIVCYPDNPTTALADLNFYRELVAFCKREEIYIISDLAYCEIYFEEKDKPHSILEIEGAKDVAIEFTSMSKSYSMPGCRVGFAAGNPVLIAALTKVKTFLDYGSFNPIQLASVEALCEKSDEYLKNLRKLYKNRADFFVDLLAKEIGWNVEKPKASMFIWTKIPQKFSHLTSMQFCEELIMKTGIAIAPGSAFGGAGEGYIRFSLIHNEEKMREAVLRLKKVF